MFNPMIWTMLKTALLETLYMVGVSTVFAVVLGLPLGILLVITSEGHIKPNKWFNTILGWIVNVGRSVPFIILMVAIINFTRWLVGTSIGTTAAIVPLTISAIPFFARVTEQSLREVDKGIIEAAQAMGATTMQIIIKVLLPEAFSSLVLAMTITAVNLIGYSAMAGAIGGGGLGDLAIRYGYQRFRGDIMLITVIVLVILVQGVQTIGNFIARRLSHK
ncbi:MAG: ABC transporter permease [Firmicutes bacterium]|nr:ABC transporter permease [Bacillota bacterium]MDD4694693.1 ABC transporter permease [Bacillota bacterium]